LLSATAAKQLQGSAACKRPSSPPLWLSFIDAAAAVTALDQLCANLQPLQEAQQKQTAGSMSAENITKQHQGQTVQLLVDNILAWLNVLSFGLVLLFACIACCVRCFATAAVGEMC
jgi:hypothetical protein